MEKFSPEEFISEIAVPVYIGINALTEDQIKEVQKTSRQQNTTNCGWIEYQMSTAIQYFCKSALEHKRYEKKATPTPD